MKCLLDLDGVLSDFAAGAHQFHNIPYSYDKYPYPLGEWEWMSPEFAGMTTKQFWNSLTADFWANLPWMPGGKAILCLIETYFGADNICIVTCPTLSESASGKMRWIKKNIPEYCERFFIGPAKYFCAHKGAVLVDDADHNTAAFREHGGLTVLVPRNWNSRHGKPVLETIETDICAIRGMFGE